MPFEQKVVVITGASRGIGASLVERFRKIGYGVVANSRSIDAAGDPAVLVVDGDIAGRDTAERVVNIERFGRIDTLINNAGVFIPKQFIDYSETDFAMMIAVNLGGFFHLSQKAATWMLRAGSGHIVNVTPPGVVRTPMHSRQMHVFLAGLQPMGRMAETQEIVDTVLYREKAAFVTGEILHVDGGWSAGRG